MPDSNQHSEHDASTIAKAALHEVARLPDLQSIMLSRTSLAILANGYLGLLEQLQAAGEFKAAMVRANERQVDEITGLREQLEAAQERVTFWKNQARRARMTDGICGVIVDSSWHEPVACAFAPDHEGDHSWASIPAHNPATSSERVTGVVGVSPNAPSSTDQTRSEVPSPACKHPDVSFDRSLCGMCGAMHYFCTECGAQTDECSPARELHVEFDGTGTHLPPIEESVPRGLEPIPRIVGPRLAEPGAGTDPSNQDTRDS